MKKTNYFGFILFFILFCNSIISQTLFDNFPVTNNEVKAFAQYNNTTYIGGTFDYVGPNTGRGVLIDQITGNYNPLFPKINGEVFACISDGAGGWYIGGNFTKVGNQYRNNVVHIKNDMTVDSWNPNIHWADGNSNSKVFSITKNGNKIYIGGFFDSVGDSTRILLACVDSSTAIATSFNTKMLINLPNDGVYSIAVRDTIVFIGGSWSRINESVSRIGLASVSANTGLVTNWNPSVGGGFTSLPYFGPVVYGLNLYNDTTLYVWGNFQSINSQTRWGLAAVKPDAVGSGLYLYGWRPNNVTSILNFRPIRSIAISGDTVFVGGDFVRFGSNTTVRNRLAACSRITNTVFPWNPNVDNNLGTSGSATYQHRINNLIVINDTVYVGGLFSTIDTSGGQRKNMAAITKSGTLLSLNPNPNIIGSGDLANSVNVLLNEGNNIFVGGKFSSINGVKRNYLAAFDATNGNILPLDLNINGFSVSNLFVHNSNLFVGGGFSSIGGVSINNLAKVDLITGNVDPSWIINPDLQVDGALGVHNDTLYVSGTFSLIGDSSGSQYRRERNASIDIATGQVTSWNPNANNGFKSFIFQDTLIYVGGIFNFIGDSTRNFLACISSRTALPTSWNPNPDGVVNDIALVGQNIFAAGTFSQVGGILKNRLAQIDKQTGLVTEWDAGLTNQELNSITVSGDQLYFSGSFQSVGVSERKNLASINIIDGSLTSWNPNSDSPVNKIFLDFTNKRIYLGGYFQTINSDPFTYLAVLDNPEDPLPVELTSFTLNILSSGVELKWQTATEVNNYGFEILRSAQNDEWINLGFIQGNGNSNSPKDYSYVDEDIKNQANGKYYYRLKQIDTDGSYKYSESIEVDWKDGITDVNDDSNLPKEFSLSQNYPNPFNPSTVINYQLPVNSRVVLKVYDVIGKEVATLINKEQEAGYHTAQFSGKGLSSGMYFYKIEAGNFVQVKKMILLK
ncbi:MAG: hypothetical protein STSR0008_21730 [Ignavibacterium sp.]